MRALAQALPSARARAVVALLLAVSAMPACAQTAEPLPVSDAVPVLDPNAAEFPDSSLVDLGARRAPRPEGFLRVDDQGRFVWPGGERARFWGINVASESVFQPRERIDEVVERIRRAGFDLVRIHHIDGTARGLIVGDGDSLTIDAEKLALLDHWIWRLGQANIAVFLDLLDYRAFLPGDGVPAADALGRGAKPYALFDERLIALQKRYARELLREHVNPLTGLCYADDPTVAMVELYDENGLFIRRGDWPRLAEPYRSRLERKWNQFLLQRYGSTPALVAAWSQSGAGSPLRAGERIEAGTVPLPELKLRPDQFAATPAERLAQAKTADAARFAYSVHRAYFREMADYLRDEVGVKVPLSAVGDANVVPDLLSVAHELDFIGTNYYWDHPIFRAGNDWRMPFLFHFSNPLQSLDPMAFAPKVAMAKLAGKPVVVREWNHCFPNPHRAAGMVEATAYAALQDVDAMILFTYGAVPTARRIDYFDVHQDPARWGLAALLGEVFRSRAVAPAKREVEIGYSEVDTFLFKSYLTPLRNLAWTSRVSTRGFDESLNATADLTVASGRSAAARYDGGPLLLFRNDPTLTTGGEVASATGTHLGYPLPLSQGDGGRYWFEGEFLLPSGSWPRNAGGRFRLSAIDASPARAVGYGERDAIGFWDAERRVLGFGPLTAAEQWRAALDVLAEVYGDEVGRGAEERGRIASDTGELLRDTAAGRLTLAAPRAVGVAGNLGGGSHALGDLRLETASERGAALVVSLDGKPLRESRHWAAKFVGDAVNSDMQLNPPGPDNNPRHLYILDHGGGGPILSNGRRVSAGWRVYQGEELLCAVGLAGGAAEVVRDGDSYTWYVDTPGTWVRVPNVTRAVAVAADGAETPLEGGSAWAFPDGAALVRAAP